MSQVHVLAKDPAEDLLETLDDGVQAHDARLDHLLPAEGEQLTSQRRGTIGGLADLLDIAPLGIVGPEVLQQQIAVARDHREQIIEVVRDPARQSPHGLHLLRLQELLLEPPLVGHVADECFVILHVARAVAHRAHAQLHGQEMPVFALPGRFHVVVLAIGVGIPVDEPLALGGIGVHIPRHVEPQDLGGGVVPEHADHCGIHRQDLALWGGAVDADGGVLDQRSIAGLRRAQRRPGLRLTQLTLDRGEEALELALGEVIARARLHGRDGLVFADRARYTNEGNVQTSLPQERQRRCAAEGRHAVIADDQIPALALEGGQHGRGVVDPLERRLVPPALELAHEQQRVLLGVFDKQHAERQAHGR